MAWTREFECGPVCSFYPDKTTGKPAIRQRINPLVSSSHTLSKLMVRGRNNATDTTFRMVGGNWEVGWFCESTHGLILPIKGERTLATPYVSKPVEFYPGSERRPFLGGLAFHTDIQPSHIDQLCAEVRDEHGYWENSKAHQSPGGLYLPRPLCRRY